MQNTAALLFFQFLENTVEVSCIIYEHVGQRDALEKQVFHLAFLLYGILKTEILPSLQTKCRSLCIWVTFAVILFFISPSCIALPLEMHACLMVLWFLGDFLYPFFYCTNVSWYYKNKALSPQTFCITFGLFHWISCWSFLVRNEYE